VLLVTGATAGWSLVTLEATDPAVAGVVFGDDAHERQAGFASTFSPPSPCLLLGIAGH